MSPTLKPNPAAYFYAASPAHSGVSRFDTAAQRDAYVAEHDGFAIAVEDVAPEVLDYFGERDAAELAAYLSGAGYAEDAEGVWRGEYGYAVDIEQARISMAIAARRARDDAERAGAIEAAEAGVAFTMSAELAAVWLSTETRLSERNAARALEGGGVKRTSEASYKRNADGTVTRDPNGARR